MDGTKRRVHSYPFTVTEEVDFKTANDYVPIRVPLEKVKVGQWKYTAKELGDIEFLYELQSSDLLIKTDVCGTNGADCGILRLTQVSAADLALISVVPGSLESMVARLILETEEDIIFEPAIPKEMSLESSQSGSTLSNDCRIVTITASVHESGHLRDLLLFLKSNYAASDLSPDSVFLSPNRATPSEVRSPSGVRSRSGQREEVEDEEEEEEKDAGPQVTFLEGLPFWVVYIPWQLYTKKARTVIQWIVLLYSIFSVIWACWQLYRHVNVIRFVIAPIIALIKPYLYFLFDWFDYFFAIFTEAWQKFLSPLNILRGIVITPLLGTLLQLKEVFAPLASSLMQCLTNSGLLSALRSLSMLVWSLIGIIRKPFSFIWNGILNSRIAVASLDLPRLQLQWVWSLIVNSFKTITFGFAKLFGYTRRQHKRRKALHYLAQGSNSPDKSPRASPTLSQNQHAIRQRMPVYYSSPLTRTTLT